VDPILVIGAETVVGANLCVHWSEKLDVIGVSEARLNLAGCRVITVPTSRRDLSSLIRETSASTVVLCGAGARSSWESAPSRSELEASVEEAAGWAGACASAGIRFVHVSSDAVFSGPWMFHDEDSECRCISREADLIRSAEAQVLRSPQSLVVRTNAFGWSPGGRGGWLETLLAQIEARRPINVDPIRHATPILATDLADFLELAIGQQLSGTVHIAGAERISPLGFAQRLASQFSLPWVPVRRDGALTDPPSGFGAGECCLQTVRIRRALCRAMPLLSESLDRLESQQINGHRERLGAHPTVQLNAA
jgi:dTDP-4-dehydrorhamnose reductase